MGRKFLKFHKKNKFIAPLLLTIINMQCVCGTNFQPFNIRLKPVCNSDMRRFGHSNQHLKIMDFENYGLLCNNILHFLTNEHTRDHPVCDVHLNR